MKNKVINLFDKPQVVVQNEGVKYSGLIEKFLEPFINEFADVEFYEDVFEFAINAWNYANMKVLLPNEESDAAINALPGDDLDFVLLKKMIDYKISNFKEYTNFIVDYELNGTDNDPILSIITQPEEQYLSGMMRKMSEEFEEEPEEDFEDNFEDNFVNRYAIIIKPRQPFLDWYSNLCPEDEVYNNTNTYLISDAIDDIDSWIKKQYEKIFAAELEAWTTIEKKWPKKRNYEMFKEWFYIDQSTLVYDLEKSPVRKL